MSLLPGIDAHAATPRHLSCRCQGPGGSPPPKSLRRSATDITPLPGITRAALPAAQARLLHTPQACVKCSMRGVHIDTATRGSGPTPQRQSVNLATRIGPSTAPTTATADLQVLLGADEGTRTLD